MTHDSGALYVSSASRHIVVFAPGAAGDAAPVREISDPTVGTAVTGTGIAVRL